MSGRISSRHRRAEFTCEWATKRVNDFARGKNSLLVLSGKEYSGKSVLAGWIAERISNTRGRLGHDVIFFDVDPALKEQVHPVSIAKGVALQAFDRLVGDEQFYRALCSVIHADTEGKRPHELAELLWVALDKALSKLDKTMLIVDGCEVLGEDEQYSLLNRLAGLTSKHTNLKTIAVSRPLTKAPPRHTKVWTIEKEDTLRDIQSFAHERLSDYPSLQALPHSQIHEFAERIATASNGSFAWADVAIEVVAQEKTLTNISKTMDGLPKNLKELINRLVSTVDLSNKDARASLAWMLAAQRPLLLDEVKNLFQIDCSALQITERFNDPEEDVRQACGGLVSVTDGILRFRSLAIRHHLLELAASVKDFSNSSKNAFPFHIAEAPYDICLRSLAYIKLVLDRTYPIAVEFLTQEQLIEVFSEHSFLEYSARYWMVHFRSSPMHQYPKEHKLTGTFKSCLPDVVSLARIEGTCLRAQYDLHESCDLLLLCVKLRRMVFGEETQSVLQTTINLAMTRQRLLNQDTNVYYYEAFKLSRKLFSEESEISLICARQYIDSVKTMIKTTEIEETLTYITEVQRRQYGVSHDTTIFYMRRLAEYYLAIKETTKASNLYIELYEVMASKYGYHHTETESVYHKLTTAATKEQLAQISKKQQTSAEKTLDVDDTRRMTSTKDLVNQYEQEKDVEKAEEVMVNYWREISEKSRTSRDVKVQEQQVDVTMEYVQFLQRQNRKEEATTILNGLYLELEKSTSYSDTKISWIQRIGNELKSMGSTSASRGVFSYLWSYYRSTGQQTTKEAQTVAKSLSESASSTVTTTSSTDEQVDILREILETNTLTSQTVDQTTINTAQQLISAYSRQERHEEIIEVTRDVLQRAWPSVLTGQKDTRLTQSFSSEMVSIAQKLATSYMRLSYVEEASTVMYGIFAAHYQTVYRHNDALNIYQSLYETLVSVYGATHQQTISVTYEKADYELKQNRRKQALASYEMIYSSLKDSKSETCSKEAIHAAQSMCSIYEKEQNWKAAQSVYHVLWQTFLQKGQEYNLGIEFVDKVFDRYLYILENKTSVDFATRRQLALDYRQTRIKYYGQENERTISATLKLAQLNEKDEKYKADAIAMYEAILSSNKSTAASMFSVAATARRRLAHLYSEMSVTHERAQNLYIDEFEVVRNKSGVSHPDALFWLGLLVTCLKKRNTQQDSKAATERLQGVSTEILLQENDTSRLYEASESNITSLKGKTLTRRSFTFVVGFEEGISGGQFSVIMSELMTESILVTTFNKQKKSNASFDVILSTGNRLRVSLKNKGRQDYTTVEKEIFEIFMDKVVGKNSQIDNSAARQFFDIVLAELDKDSHDLNVLRVTLDAVTRAFNENQFSRGYSLAFIADKYMHHFDGFRSQSKIELALQICLRLSGRGTRKTGDKDIEQKMSQLSGALLQEVLQAAKAIRFSLISLPLSDLNLLVGILGQTKNYTDLEWILHDLWSARHSQTSWPATTVVAIGRRLVECRFSMGERSSALDLLEDICYNLRRVWGPLDKTTVEMEQLRSQMYTSLGQHTRAMGVHEDILAHLTSDELDMDQVTGKEEADIAVRHVQQLRLAFLKNGAKWPRDKDEGVYDELYHIVAEQVSDQDAWRNAKVEDVNKWGAAVKSFKDDGSGAWRGVPEGQWEFMADDGKYKHINAMKRRSARYSSGYFVNGTNGKSNGAAVSRDDVIAAPTGKKDAAVTKGEFVNIQGTRPVQVNGS
ncbi:hypothetical protein LTR70_001723 [Exophiala xenobiotica]|uniref:Nephrocystin 3-like N-terminal domain-containing protein n=1 Tax=Lithohypha guttulata TaxID=1690604 RepID=A0ABR0KMD7_9EURO|nr:hypothetical protein LTR24_001085 [Lithohypha guttulata]KAK5326981.1 hypothetical protein LTR70_001723 [Exophiala xenobiotica]